MALLDTEQSPLVMSDGAEVKRRRKRIGMTVEDLAAEADVSRDTLSDYEKGVRKPHPSTVRKVREALERIEHETGLDAPGRSGDIIEFEVSGDYGVRVVVRGPIRDADELQRSVAALVQQIRATGSAVAEGHEQDKP